jgi:polysaccharide biosynthesis/export protein
VISPLKHRTPQSSSAYLSKVSLGRIICIAGLIFTGACRSFLKAPAQPADDPAFTPPATVELPGLPNDAPAPYILQPGDIIRLRVSSVDPMDLPDLLVDPSGHLHVPLSGDVVVGGQSLGEAEKRIEEALRRHDRFARALLSVTSPAGQRATVIGVVAKPGVYEIKPNARITEVMALAGGPRTRDDEGDSIELSDIAGARIVRDGTALPVSFSRALAGDPLHNVHVRTGDILYVPPAQSRRIVILGEVHAAKAVPFRRGLRLSEALALAGGTTKDADDADVRVVRGPLSRPRVYRADLKALIAGDGGDVELAPGDIVFVTEHWFATATDVINRLTPALSAATLTSALVRR